MTLPSPKQLLDRFGLKPKYSFGQNFLSDPALQQRICDLVVAGVTPSDAVHVLEIGAGLGALTSHLLARGYRVSAVERDRDLIGPLKELFAGPLETGQLRLFEADAKTLDWESVFEPQDRAVLAGNLPYQLTGTLLEKTVQFGRTLEGACYLVQREVAARLAAGPSEPEYGALSVFVSARFRVEKPLIVKGGAFVPPPRVDSAVVRLVPHQVPRAEETRAFQNVVRAAFQARRKTLRNAWRGLAPKETLESICERAGVSLDARGETLAVEDFARVAQLLRSEREARRDDVP